MESKSSSAERPNWRRTLASEDTANLGRDDRSRVERSNLAPPNREIYRGPDPIVPPVKDQDGETPTWMGVSTQIPSETQVK